MTFEEYEQKIQHAVLNQDEIPVIMQEILKELKTDLTTLESFKTKTTEQDAKIKALQESNVKLFLGQTEKPSDEKTGTNTTEDYEDMEGIEAVDAFMKSKNIGSFIVESEENNHGNNEKQ